jgi:hypothetical protein
MRGPGSGAAGSSAGGSAGSSRRQLGARRRYAIPLVGQVGGRGGGGQVRIRPLCGPREMPPPPPLMMMARNVMKSSNQAGAASRFVAPIGAGGPQHFGRARLSPRVSAE